MKNYIPVNLLKLNSWTNYCFYPTSSIFPPPIYKYSNHSNLKVKAMPVENPFFWLVHHFLPMTTFSSWFWRPKDNVCQFLYDNRLLTLLKQWGWAFYLDFDMKIIHRFSPKLELMFCWKAFSRLGNYFLVVKEQCRFGEQVNMSL